MDINMPVPMNTANNLAMNFILCLQILTSVCWELTGAVRPAPTLLAVTHVDAILDSLSTLMVKGVMVRLTEAIMYIFDLFCHTVLQISTSAYQVVPIPVSTLVSTFPDLTHAHAILDTG